MPPFGEYEPATDVIRIPTTDADTPTITKPRMRSGTTRTPDSRAASELPPIAYM